MGKVSYLFLLEILYQKNKCRIIKTALYSLGPAPRSGRLMVRSGMAPYKIDKLHNYVCISQPLSWQVSWALVLPFSPSG